MSIKDTYGMNTPNGVGFSSTVASNIVGGDAAFATVAAQALATPSGGNIPIGGNGIIPSNWLATQEFTNPTAYTGTGSTFGIRRDVPVPFVGGRLIAYNAGAIPVAGDVNYVAGVANTAVVNTQASGFVTPTWGPLGSSGPVAAGLFKGTPSSTIIEQVLSNPFALQSIPRADGGTGYIGEARAYVNTGVTTTYSTGTDVLAATIQNITAGGRSYAGFR